MFLFRKKEASEEAANNVARTSAATSSPSWKTKGSSSEKSPPTAKGG